MMIKSELRMRNRAARHCEGLSSADRHWSNAVEGFLPCRGLPQGLCAHDPDNPYIQVCDRPKIGSLKRQFPELFIENKGRHW